VIFVDLSAVTFMDSTAIQDACVRLRPFARERQPASRCDAPRIACVTFFVSAALTGLLPFAD